MQQQVVAGLSLIFAIPAKKPVIPTQTSAKSALALAPAMSRIMPAAVARALPPAVQRVPRPVPPHAQQLAPRLAMQVAMVAVARHVISNALLPKIVNALPGCANSLCKD